MTYSPSIPLPTDIPAENQPDFLFNFEDLNADFAVNHTPFGNAITGLSNANPAVVTSPNHGQVTGATVNLNRVRGLIPGRENIEKYQTVWPVTNPYVITVIDADHFSLNGFNTSNQAIFPPYVVTSGDFSVTTAGYPYGFHTKLSFAVPSQTPDRVTPIASVYPQLFKSAMEMFFQNNNGPTFISMLTNCNFVENEFGVGIKTPWKLILNMGQVQFTNLPTTYTFAQAYANPPLSIVTSTVDGGPNLRFGPGFVSNLTATSFSVSHGGVNAVSIAGYYLAIGV